MLIGNLASYGFADLYDHTAGAVVRVYIEDYWLSRTDVIRMYLDMCGARLGGLGRLPRLPAYAPPLISPNANLTRVARDIYRDTYTGGYVRTRSCYAYEYYADAIVTAATVFFVNSGQWCERAR